MKNGGVWRRLAGSLLGTRQIHLCGAVRNKKGERTMKKCLTPEERKEKQVAIKYLYRELYERLECLDYKPDSLCNAYLTIIESMQNQINKRDIIKETHDFIDSRKIGIETMMQAFSFFSGMTQDEKNQMMKAYKNGEFDGHKDQNS